MIESSDILTDLYIGLAAASLTVLLCTSKFNELLPQWKLLDCPFCTSCHLTILLSVIGHWPNLSLLWLSVPACVTVANLGILFIHWAMSTYTSLTHEEVPPYDNEKVA